MNAGIYKYIINGNDPRSIGGGLFSDTIDAGVGKWSPVHVLLLIPSQDLTKPQISEIHYHPLDEGLISGKSFEFLELKNTGAATLDISLFSFLDGILFTFSPGTQITAGDFIVLASDSTYFEQRYGFRPFDQFEGQLDNAGEKIVLATAALDTLFMIQYADTLPWPVQADGDGYSLVWTNKNGNNNANDPVNWAASAAIHGSPGADDLRSVISNQVDSPPLRYQLYQNYPNPFNPSTAIHFDIPKAANTQLIIYDILGRKVDVLLDQELIPGQYKVVWNAKSVSAGLYFYTLRTQEFSKTNKMLLLR